MLDFELLLFDTIMCFSKKVTSAFLPIWAIHFENLKDLSKECQSQTLLKVKGDFNQGRTGAISSNLPMNPALMLCDNLQIIEHDQNS